MLTRLPIRRAALLTLAASCVVGAVMSGPAVGVPQLVASRGPIGGAAMGMSGTVHTPSGGAIPASVTAPTFVLADVTTGAIYAARRPHLRTPPASTFKTLTTLTILRNVPLTKRVTMNPADQAGLECTCVGLSPGRQYVVGQALRAMLMRSGNDVANMVAASTGSKARGVALMNAEAHDLQADDTHAATPSGLDGPGQSTSAYDLALINRADYLDPRFRAIMATHVYDFGPVGGPTKHLVSQNELWRMGYPGQIGGKDGWTTPARHTFVGAASRNGRTLVVSVLGADASAASQAATLLTWGFGLPPHPRAVGTLAIPRRSELAAQAAARAAEGKRLAAVEASARAKAVTREAAADPGAPATSPVPATSVATTPRSGLKAQASFSMGAVAFAGLALWPGRKPRPSRTTRGRRRPSPSPGRRPTPRSSPSRRR